MLDVEDVSLYKQVSQKKNTVYICKPPKNTGDTSYFVRGVAGGLNVVDECAILEYFMLSDNTRITKSILRSKEENLNGKTIIDWFSAIAIPSDLKFWAVYVPKENVFQVQLSQNNFRTINQPNRAGASNKLGEFIVVRDCNGRPDLSLKRIVYGENFAETYDMRSFPGLAKESYILAAPKSLKEDLNSKITLNDIGVVPSLRKKPCSIEYYKDVQNIEKLNTITKKLFNRLKENGFSISNEIFKSTNEEKGFCTYTFDLNFKNKLITNIKLNVGDLVKRIELNKCENFIALMCVLGIKNGDKKLFKSCKYSESIYVCVDTMYDYIVKSVLLYSGTVTYLDLPNLDIKLLGLSEQDLKGISKAPK